MFKYLERNSTYMFKLSLYRKIWFLFILILIISLMIYETKYYADYSRNNFNLKNYFENPQKYGNYRSEVFGKIVNISQDHFYFDVGGERIKVLGKGIQKSVLGETVLYVEYKKDGNIVMIDYHNYNYNYILYAISFLAVVVFVFLFFKEWKITSRGFKNA